MINKMLGVVEKVAIYLGHKRVIVSRVVKNNQLQLLNLKLYLFLSGKISSYIFTCLTKFEGI